MTARGARTGLEHPSQLRAIPHNSILQQLGTLANTIGGVGEAVAKDPSASTTSIARARASGAW